MSVSRSIPYDIVVYVIAVYVTFNKLCGFGRHSIDLNIQNNIIHPFTNWHIT